MKLNDFKLMYTRSEDRLLLLVDAQGQGTLRCWLTRNFTREWLHDMQRFQHQSFLQGSPLAAAAPQQTSPITGFADTGSAADMDEDTPQAASRTHTDVRPRQLVSGAELSDLAVAVSARFEASGPHISSIIEFTDSSEVTLSLSAEVWLEVAKIIHKADLIANWGLCGGAESPSDDDRTTFPASSHAGRVQTKRLH
jgi:hypothetical protein